MLLDYRFQVLRDGPVKCDITQMRIPITLGRMSAESRPTTCEPTPSPTQMGWFTPAMPLLAGNGVGVFVTDTEEVNVVELNVVNVVEGEDTVTGKDVVTVVSASVDDGEPP